MNSSKVKRVWSGEQMSKRSQLGVYARHSKNEQRVYSDVNVVMNYES